MKLFSLICEILLNILIFTKSKQFDYDETSINKDSDKEKTSEINDPDKELERIRDYMWEIAENLGKKSNLQRKRLEIGMLRDEYPESMREKAKLVRQDKKLWNKVMLYPSSFWRMCIFPNFKINYVSWCYQKLALTKTSIKLNGCLNNFCLVCCDHLQLHFKAIADSNEIGEKFMLNEEKGFRNIKYIITDDEVNDCRKACKKEYKIAMPHILPTPPRDVTLGALYKNPAVSCADIKKWGSENAKSGEYWLELSSKGKQKVYCDMETDGGGWTLFYNYVHLPGQELILDSSKLPTNLEENSHMHLNNAGFSSKDVKEIRFFCTEVFNDNKIYWHFKTISNEFIQVALTGDQDYFRAYSLENSYTELPPNSKINGRYKKRIFENMVDKIKDFGTSAEGGFAISPFGIYNYGYWTIRGSSINNPKYECSTNHDYVGGYSTPQYSPNMVKSHHTIWFRGEPPSEEKVQNRLINRIRNDPS